MEDNVCDRMFYMTELTDQSSVMKDALNVGVRNEKVFDNIVNGIKLGGIEQNYRDSKIWTSGIFGKIEGLCLDYGKQTDDRKLQVQTMADGIELIASYGKEGATISVIRDNTPVELISVEKKGRQIDDKATYKEMFFNIDSMRSALQNEKIPINRAQDELLKFVNGK